MTPGTRGCWQSIRLLDLGWSQWRRCTAASPGRVGVGDEGPYKGLQLPCSPCALREATEHFGTSSPGSSNDVQHHPLNGDDKRSVMFAPRPEKHGECNAARPVRAVAALDSRVGGIVTPPVLLADGPVRNHGCRGVPSNF